MDIQTEVENARNLPSDRSFVRFGLRLAALAGTVQRDEARDEIQIEALEAISQGLLNGVCRGAVELPSRVGKSRLIAYLCHAAAGCGLRTLVLSPMREGLTQINSELMRFQDSRDSTELMTYAAFALHGKRGAINTASYDVIIPDESHEALTKLRLAPLRDFSGVLIPTSATLSYGGEKSVDLLTSTLFYSLSIVDVAKRGALADFSTYLINSRIDLSSIPASRLGYAQDALDIKLTSATAMAVALKAYREIAGGEACIGYLDTTRQAAAWAEYFRQNGIAASHISGDDPDRALKISALRAGEIDVLFSTKLLARAFDLPNVSVVLNGTPTASPVRAKQRGARCLTKDPSNPNKVGKVIELLYDDSRWTVRQVLFHEVAGVISSRSGEVSEYRPTLERPSNITRQGTTRPREFIVHNAKEVAEITDERRLQYLRRQESISLPQAVAFFASLSEIMRPDADTSLESLLEGASPSVLGAATRQAGLSITPDERALRRVLSRFDLSSLIAAQFHHPFDLESAKAALLVDLRSSKLAAIVGFAKTEDEFAQVVRSLSQYDEVAPRLWSAYRAGISSRLEAMARRFRHPEELTPEQLDEVAADAFTDWLYDSETTNSKAYELAAAIGVAVVSEADSRSLELATLANLPAPDMHYGSLIDEVLSLAANELDENSLQVVVAYLTDSTSSKSKLATSFKRKAVDSAFKWMKPLFQLGPFVDDLSSIRANMIKLQNLFGNERLSEAIRSRSFRRIDTMLALAKDWYPACDDFRDPDRAFELVAQLCPTIRRLRCLWSDLKSATSLDADVVRRMQSEIERCRDDINVELGHEIEGWAVRYIDLQRISLNPLATIFRSQYFASGRADFRRETIRELNDLLSLSGEFTDPQRAMFLLGELFPDVRYLEYEILTYFLLEDPDQRWLLRGDLGWEYVFESARSPKDSNAEEILKSYGMDQLIFDYVEKTGNACILARRAFGEKKLKRLTRDLARAEGYFRKETDLRMRDLARSRFWQHELERLNYNLTYYPNVRDPGDLIIRVLLRGHNPRLFKT